MHAEVVDHHESLTTLQKLRNFVEKIAVRGSVNRRIDDVKSDNFSIHVDRRSNRNRLESYLFALYGQGLALRGKPHLWAHLRR